MESSHDIVVVGAGMAGSAAAVVLGRQGFRVALIDPRPRCEPQLRAEKIADDQAQLLRKLDLLDCVAPATGHVREVQAAYNGRIFKTIPLEQYGAPYADIVNALRSQLPERVTFKLGHVRHVENSPGMQRMELDGGEALTARLVVLASGVSHKIQTSLGLRRRILQKDQCFVFGFTATAANGRPFDFDSITYYPTTSADHIDYLSLFKFPQSMRANLFVFRSGDDPWIRRFLKEPAGMLQTSLPKLKCVIGDYDVDGPVDSGMVDLYVTDGAVQPGVVVIGDAYESACPATGLGMNKIFTDVDVLSECLPPWLATPGMGVEKINQFYAHPRKRRLEEQALRRASSERRLAIDRSAKWRLKRLITHLQMQFGMG